MHGTSHRKNTLGMLEVIGEAVLGKFALDMIAGAAGTGAVRTAALQHKAPDDPMEGQTIVKALLDEADKVVDSVGRYGRIQFCLHNAAVLHGDGNNRILCHNISPFGYICRCSGTFYPIIPYLSPEINFFCYPLLFQTITKKIDKKEGMRYNKSVYFVRMHKT